MSWLLRCCQLPESHKSTGPFKFAKLEKNKGKKKNPKAAFFVNDMFGRRLSCSPGSSAVIAPVAQRLQWELAGAEKTWRLQEPSRGRSAASWDSPPAGPNSQRTPVALCPVGWLCRRGLREGVRPPPRLRRVLGQRHLKAHPPLAAVFPGIPTVSQHREPLSPAASRALAALSAHRAFAWLQGSICPPRSPAHVPSPWASPGRPPQAGTRLRSSGWRRSLVGGCPGGQGSFCHPQPSCRAGGCFPVPCVCWCRAVTAPPGQPHAWRCRAPRRLRSRWAAARLGTMMTKTPK